jgi:hypothetical protein
MPSARRSRKEIARRREIVARLWGEGYTLAQIARAVGVGAGVVARDVDTTHPERPRPGIRTAPVKPDPPRETWISEQIIPALVENGSTARADRVTNLLRTTHRQLVNLNYRNAFANTAIRMEEDHYWPRLSREALDDLEHDLAVLRRIRDDRDFRERMASTADGRDDLLKDLRTPLRQ